MFDYDARPVTPQVILAGTQASAAAYAIRDFLTRNGQPYDWVDADQPGAELLLHVEKIDASRLPLCVLPDGTRLESATVEQVAAGLGVVSPPPLAPDDPALVGAGPAGPPPAPYAPSRGPGDVGIDAAAPRGAGRAALRFSRRARLVTVLVRGERLAASMSQYLIDRISGVGNIVVRTGVHVAAADGDGRLRELVVASGEGDVSERLPADALFIAI